MALTTGSHLGPYEILAPLGAGGMGEVYRATDTRLKRQVAVKILPPLLAADPDRLARFQREAEVLASLNHPGIAAIYGIEDAGGMTALVMELVEGEDLADRIARGPIPIDDALPITRQIAEALDAAHERGIVHRDLKPANIKLRADGAVKVLDFGLAKLAEPPAAGDVAQSATITSPTLLSAAGVILGTAAYMSPEQARGQAADKRSDIWAFGVVVFEMLAGQRPFAGDTISDTLASVLKTEPDWRALPAAAPPRLRGLLRWCLEKNPARRLRDIGDARLQLDDLIGAPGETGTPIDRRLPPGWPRALPWTITAAFAAALAAVVIVWGPWRTGPAATVARLSIDIGADASMTATGLDAIAVSPSGDVIAFAAQTGANPRQQLYVRRLEQLEATPLSGTDDAASPFFSPDGQWIAFFADGKLKKISVAGGAVVEVCSAPIPRGGAWDRDDTIVLLPNRIGALMRVPASGGTPQPFITIGDGEVTQRWPQLLPGGKGVLFTGGIGLNTGYNEGALIVQPLPAGARVVVQRGGFHARYLPSGHIVYIHDGTLFAIPFDLDRLSATGPPVPVLEGIVSNAGTGGAHFAVSESGTLVYLHGPSIITAGIPMQWMNQSGKATPLRPTRAVWTNAAFSPAGDRLAVQILGTQTDIWVYDVARETLTPVTVDPAADMRPVWSPDGRYLAFGSARANNSTTNLYLQRADGSGAAQRLTDGPNPQQPASWHKSGRYLMLEEVNPTTNRDLMLLSLEGDAVSGWKPGTPAAFLNSIADEQQAAFSPDGRWVAYTSNESGRDEVYVRPFPGPGGKWQISTEGGYSPVWSRTQPEILYGAGGANRPTRQIMVSRYVAGAETFASGKPRLWAEPAFQARGPNTRMFDVHPDGTRVVVALSEDVTLAGKQNHLTVVLNFFDELRRRVPPQR